ncbi:MAG: response regulator [Gammaproteobacteria bacterium]|nr:response regulator [Gammaproteobacteria bacterium]
MSSSNKVVFLVEPDSAVRDSIRSLLESFDVSIKTYASGRSFLNNAKPNGHGCVLVESDLPDMTGVDLSKYIRQQGQTLPVVLLTSSNDVGFEKLNQPAVSAILHKPLKSQDLVKLIESL